MTGNLGGEDNRDHVRGPRNEGAMFAERQGYHLPAPPSEDWEVSNPMKGLQEAGVRFYSTSFELKVPEGYDVPMSFVFNGGEYGGGEAGGGEGGGGGEQTVAAEDPTAGGGGMTMDEYNEQMMLMENQMAQNQLAMDLQAQTNQLTVQGSLLMSEAAGNTYVYY